MKKNIIISVSNDLTGDQRVYKTILMLLEKNYNVICLGRKNKSKIEPALPCKTKRFRLIFNKGFLFYSELNIRIFIFLIFSKADLYLANDLDTLPANYIASKLKKVKLIYDSHEYFTEVPELAERKFVKSFWSKIESRILPKIKFSYTVCKSIADIYSKKYGIDMKVVRNIPICQGSKNQFHKTKEKPEIKTIIYQGSVNIGRGLEQIIEAMKFTENMELIIIGNGDIFKNLQEKVKTLNLEKKVFLKGKLHFKDLIQYTINADIGISIEENIGLNYYYALPNKIFDYINAGIPVLASRLPEIENIINKYQIGEFIENHNPEHIALRLKEILSSEVKLNFYINNEQKASKELCWQNEFKNVENFF